ncbi:hypothetical protein V6N13_129701 [Hibiscus sabdariffa]
MKGIFWKLKSAEEAPKTESIFQLGLADISLGIDAEDGKKKRSRERNGVKVKLTLFLEIVVALEAAAEAIESLTGLANPESNGVNGFAKGSHLQLLIGDFG